VYSTYPYEGGEMSIISNELMDAVADVEARFEGGECAPRTPPVFSRSVDPLNYFSLDEDLNGKVTVDTKITFYGYGGDTL
jgi:hypothetical protein